MLWSFFQKNITTLDCNFFENTFYYRHDRQDESSIDYLSWLAYSIQSFPKPDDNTIEDLAGRLGTSLAPQVPCQIAILIPKTPSENENNEVTDSEPNSPLIKTLDANPTM